MSEALHIYKEDLCRENVFGSMRVLICWRMELKVLWSKIGLMVVATFDAHEASVERRLHATQAALGILIATSPVHFVPILIIHPKFVLLENQYRLS